MMTDDQQIKETVREKYGAAALRVIAGERSSCCHESMSLQMPRRS